MEVIDLSFIDETNAMLGAAVVFASYIFGDHWILFAAFLLLNMLDYVSGIIKSKILKNENSVAGLKGILKKFMYWCVILLAFLMSPIFNELGEVIGADISPFTPVIGYMVLAMLIMNEFRSVLENLYQCGVEVPMILLKGLSIFEKAANDIQDKIFDGKLEIHKAEDEETYQVNIEASQEEIEQKDYVTLEIKTIDD